MGEFWQTTLTKGPMAGLDVVSPHYVEHVTTGALFIPGAGSLSKGLQLKAGAGGAVSATRYLRTPTGQLAFALQQSKRASDVQKGLRVGAFRHYLNRSGLVQVGGLLSAGDYKRAAVSWYGPPGTLTVFDEITGLFRDAKTTKVVPSKPAISKNKRRWKRRKGDMHIKGMPWCDKHKRYHYC